MTVLWRIWCLLHGGHWWLLEVYDNAFWYCGHCGAIRSVTLAEHKQWYRNQAGEAND